MNVFSDIFNGSFELQPIKRPTDARNENLTTVVKQIPIIGNGQKILTNGGTRNARAVVTDRNRQTMVASGVGYYREVNGDRREQTALICSRQEQYQVPCLEEVAATAGNSCELLYTPPGN